MRFKEDLPRRRKWKQSFQKGSWPLSYHSWYESYHVLFLLRTKFQNSFWFSPACRSSSVSCCFNYSLQVSVCTIKNRAFWRKTACVCCLRFSIHQGTGVCTQVHIVHTWQQHGDGVHATAQCAQLASTPPEPRTTRVQAGRQDTITGIWGYKARLITRARSSSVPLRLSLWSKCRLVCTLWRSLSTRRDRPGAGQVPAGPGRAGQLLRQARCKIRTLVFKLQLLRSLPQPRIEPSRPGPRWTGLEQWLQGAQNLTEVHNNVQFDLKCAYCFRIWCKPGFSVCSLPLHPVHTGVHTACRTRAHCMHWHTLCTLACTLRPHWNYCEIKCTQHGWRPVHTWSQCAFTQAENFHQEMLCIKNRCVFSFHIFLGIVGKTWKNLKLFWNSF